MAGDLMRPAATGRPGTEVIPTGWAAGHHQAAEGTQTATVALRASGGTKGAFDPATGTYSVTPHTPYATDVPARVQALTNDARHTDAAGDQVTVAGYMLSVPADTAGLTVGHLAHVTGSGDPLLDGRDLTITDIVRGSLRFERDLYCTLTD